MGRNKKLSVYAMRNATLHQSGTYKVEDAPHQVNDVRGGAAAAEPSDLVGRPAAATPERDPYMVKKAMTQFTAVKREDTVKSALSTVGPGPLLEKTDLLAKT